MIEHAVKTLVGELVLPLRESGLGNTDEALRTSASLIAHSCPRILMTVTNPDKAGAD